MENVGMEKVVKNEKRKRKKWTKLKKKLRLKQCKIENEQAKM